jgi:hypothetical protein
MRVYVTAAGMAPCLIAVCEALTSLVAWEGEGAGGAHREISDELSLCMLHVHRHGSSLS